MYGSENHLIKRPFCKTFYLAKPAHVVQGVLGKKTKKNNKVIKENILQWWQAKQQPLQISRIHQQGNPFHDQEQALLFNKHINHIPEHLPVNMLPLVQHSFSEKLPSRTLAGIR